MVGHGQTCCTNTKLERQESSLEIDGLSFRYIILYCKSCGVVRPSNSHFFDGKWLTKNES